MKYFTPLEATQTFPLVKRILHDILVAGAKARQRAAELEAAKIFEDSEIKHLDKELRLTLLAQ